MVNIMHTYTHMCLYIMYTIRCFDIVLGFIFSIKAILPMCVHNVCMSRVKLENWDFLARALYYKHSNTP